MQEAATDKSIFRHVARIKGPILDIMRQYIPAKGGTHGPRILTVHDYCGELSASLADAYPGGQLQPTTGDPEFVGSINSHCHGLPNAQPGRYLHITWKDWLCGQVDAIITDHLLQSGPWEWTVGLMAGAGKYLAPGGLLFVYGPFTKEGQFMTEGDEAYDMSLKMRNPDWGYRDLAEVVAAAEAQGLRKEAIHDMPHKNFMLVFRKVLSLAVDPQFAVTSLKEWLPAMQ